MMISSTAGGRGRLGPALKAVTASLAVGMTTIACVPTSPEAGGLVGLTVDEAGHLAAVISWCARAAPDSVVVYRRGDDGDSKVAELKNTSLTGGIAFVDLEETAPGWSVTRGGLRLTNGQTYSVMAYAGDVHAQENYLVYPGPAFTMDAKKEIPPGRVLTERYEARGQADATLSIADFTVKARGFCR
ncbi:hypothetical protein [Nonomuraea rhodomycinica]|uniref:Uncharacterized protein n=1 Tax=Nonomuraea rhodomycinica TaxID=1712872 RepID=A0A7Y6IW81_9ACTN|nr:hypothetical protein [Nonomuraea rhodomycinica]NUW45208.1 hypothetical protein [Nonomuraea rhodomycinica]